MILRSKHTEHNATVSTPYLLDLYGFWWLLIEVDYAGNVSSAVCRQGGESVRDESRRTGFAK